jgi:ADP-ribose pyrophosphatase YjhB (NUDIX family)
MPEPHKHCHHCGTAYDFDDRLTKQWPRTCGACGETIWKNPVPVVVGIVRVIGSGLLTVRRDIEPARGKLAFPSGYMDLGETWREALAREIHEETSELLDIDPKYFELLGVENATTTDALLIFGACKKVIWSVDEKDLEQFKSNHEVSELRIIHSPVELAWPTHTEFAKRYFEAGKAWPEFTF